MTPLELVPASASAIPAGATFSYSPTLDRTTKALIVAIVTMVACTEFLTSYAVGVALPDIQGDLAASLDEGSWILTTYSTCFLIGLVLSDWLSARIGYRRYMIGAVAMFALSSTGCGLSHTLPAMLISRAFMGFAGGNFLVRAQTAINLTNEGRARARTLTIFAIFLAGTARLWAPLIGGYLTDWYSWRWVFFLNVPLSLMALVLLVSHPWDFKARLPSTRFDTLGLVFLIGWVASTQLVLSRGERDDWFSDPLIVALTLIAAVSLPLFIWWERRPQNIAPVVSLRLYDNPTR